MGLEVFGNLRAGRNAAPKIDNWITNQFALPRLNHNDWLIAKAVLGNVSNSDVIESFWSQALSGADQLRQRITFALSQIMVISDQKDALANNPYLFSSFLDTLIAQRVGNYRTLLEEVTKTPAMALYLDHICNEEIYIRDPMTHAITGIANPATENYAREILQLFSIGTVWLNQDGTVMLDGPGGTTGIRFRLTTSLSCRACQGVHGMVGQRQPQLVRVSEPAAQGYNPLISFNGHHSNYGTKTRWR